MAFQRKKHAKTDYEVFKELIQTNDYQTAMDEAIDQWELDPDKMEPFLQELSEKCDGLCMDHVPLVLESLYKSDEKYKTMIFCMLFELTCQELPYVTNLESIPLFGEKLAYIYHTLSVVFSSCFDGIGDCVGLIILNYDPELSLAQPEEKQCISCGVQERLKLLREYISGHGCTEEEIISTLSVTLDLASQLPDEDVLEALQAFTDFSVDPESELFLVKAMLRHNMPVSTERIDHLVEFDASRLFRILASVEKMELLNGSKITQEKIAYAEMRNWLRHPSECGETLEALEYVDTLLHEEHRYYIFKYTSSAPNLKARGFMIGVAGGYDTDAISDNETGHTFSNFEPIGDNYKEQALGIIRMISDYWKRAAGQAQ